MNKTEANQQRLIAAQIIWNLWNAGELEQIRLLEMQSASSIKDIMQKAGQAPEFTGAELISAERKRQILDEDYNASHDDAHDRGELISAAMCYASVPLLRLTYKPFEAESEITEVMATKWPWDEEWWKPDNDATRNLAKAGALIAAEIDRLERLKIKVL